MKNYIFHMVFACLFVSFLHANNTMDSHCLVCNTPALLSVTNQTGTSAKLNWVAVTGATSYLIEVENGTGNTAPFFYTTTVTTNSKIITGLTPNKSYKFKVRTNCGSQKSNWSAKFNFSSSSNIAGSCGIPFNLQATNLTTTGATLTWAAIPGATAYVVNVENGSGNPTVLNVTYTVTTPSKVISGLLPGKAYKFKVRANCSGNLGSWSSVRIFTTISQGAAERLAFQPETLIYPNPNEGNFTFQIPSHLSQTAYGKWSILSMTGNTVAQNEWQGFEDYAQTINLNNLPSGFYYFIFETEDTRYTDRFLIQK